MIKKSIKSNGKEKPIVLSDKKTKKTNNKSSTVELTKKMCTNDFLTGSRFMNDGKMWRVEEARFEDNTQMRRIKSTTGDDVVLMLSSLQNEMRSKSFKFLDDDDMSVAMRQASSTNKRRK